MAKKLAGMFSTSFEKLSGGITRHPSGELNKLGDYIFCSASGIRGT